MSDETIGLNPPIESRDPPPAERVERAPKDTGTIVDPKDSTRLHDVPATLTHSLIDATGPQRVAAMPALAPDPQVGPPPSDAFAPTEVATGTSGPVNGEGHGAGEVQTLVMTGGTAGTEEWSATDFSLPQKKCGHYLMKQFFAKGGMGEVWLAEDPVIGRSVALKRMLSDRPEQRLRFRVEAQITGQLEHPGIVPVHELGANAAGEPYYVMKFVQGRTLQKVIKDFHEQNLSGGAREVEQLKLLQMFISLCQTVGYAHSRGVLHRDLKPDNVMLGSFGETILLDWGIAKVMGQKEQTVDDETSPAARLRRSIPDTGTHHGSIMGTPSYMAPEVAAGLTDEVDERSDIFLLGATLYQMLSGRQPRSGKTFGELLMKAAMEPPHPVRSLNPLIPKALDAICRKAMAHDKQDRYRTAIELAEDIQRFAAGEPVTAYRESFPERAWRWAKRNRRTLGLAASVSLIAATAFIAAIKVRDAENRRAEATRDASCMKTVEKARSDLKMFRHLADEANFFAATTNPANEHAPYFDPDKGVALSRAAIEVAKPWGPTIEGLPLPEERAAVKSELYDLLILSAAETLRAEPGRTMVKKVLASLDQAARLGGPSNSDLRLRAIAYEQLGDETRATEMRRQAEDPNAARTALDLFLLGERERDESSARAGDQTNLKPWQLDPARMEKAVVFYRQALAIDPDHYWARLQLGRGLQSLGRFSEATEALGACIATRPLAPWGYSTLGLALAEQGRLDEAERVLNQAISLDASARPPRLHRGVVFWRQKKYDRAIADFETVLAPPDNKRLVEAAYYRGQLHLERGEVQKALDDFDRVVVASPRFRSVYLDRSLIHLANGDVPRGLADLDAYIALVRRDDPRGWEIHGLRGRLLRFRYSELPQEKRRGATGRATLELALAELSKAVQMGGAEAALFDDLGAVLEHVGRLDQAILAYTRGIASAPDFAKLRIKRGWAWEQLNQHEKALADFAAATRVAPENPEAHTGLGYVQALRKLSPDAQREAELALLHGGEDYLVLHNVACIYAALSQTEDLQATAYQDVSIALLRKALKVWKKAPAGPNELDLIKAEPAFKPIQGRKEFQELLLDPGNAN
jgi:serine/threonine protein kinase/Flp pilus assembly protein TadD